MPVIDPDAWLEQQSGTSVATNVQAQPKPNVGGKGVLDPDEWLKAQGQAGGGGGGVSNGSGGNFHLMKNTSDAQASNYSPEGAKENQVVTNFPNAAAGRTGGGASRPAIDPAMITAQPAPPLAGRQPTLGEIVSTLFTPKPGGFAQMPQSPPQDNAVVAQQFGKLGQVIMGLGNLAKKVENAIATPGGVATAGLEGVIGKAAAGGFAAQQVPEIPGQVVQALKTLKDENADLRQKLEAVGQPVVTTAMTGLMAGHAGEGIAEKLPTISRALNPSEAANADFRAQLTRKAESASGTQEQVSRQPLETTGKQYPWITEPHVIGKPAPIISAPLGSSVQSSLYHPPETEEAVGQYEDFAKRGQEEYQRQHPMEQFQRKPSGESGSVFPSGEEKQKQGKEFGLLTGPYIARNAKTTLGFDPQKVEPQQLMNRLQNLTREGKFSSDELAVYKAAGLEDELKKKPSGDQIAKWMQENGPRVEVKTMGSGVEKGSPEQVKVINDFNENLHKLETHGVQFLGMSREYGSDTAEWKPAFRVNDTKYWLQSDGTLRRQGGRLASLTEYTFPLIKKFQELHEPYSRASEDVDYQQPTHWQSITPTDVTGKGYVEGAVTIPLPESARYESGPIYPGGATHDTAQAKFPSTHSFPPNTLGFFRGYVENTADGKKVFHVVEVQSDWAARVRDDESRFQEHVTRGRAADTELGRAGYSDYVSKEGQDPLLQHWERLTLKAAIHHALSQGADEIALSDAQTAMMTEGHDRAAGGQGIQGRAIEQDIPQAAGMRLHYDTVGPKLLKELTGEEGKVRSLGTHKNSVLPADEGQPLQAREDLIFKNSSGQPKTDITARSYDLSKVKTQHGFSLFDKDKPVERAPQAQAKTEANVEKPTPRQQSDTERRAAILAETEGGVETRIQEQQQQQIGDVKPGHNFPPAPELGNSNSNSKQPDKNVIPNNAIIITKNFFADNRPSKTWTEEVKANIGYLAGKTVPRTKAIDSDVGEQLIKYGSSRITAPALGKAMASLVLGDHWEDAAFSTKLGAVIVQDLRDKMRGEYIKAGDSEQAAKVHDTWEQEDSPFKSREEYEKALNDPEIAAAVKRHMEQVQPLALEQHLATGGKQAAGGERTGAFVNLKAMFDEAESTRDMIFGSKQGNLTNPLKRGSVFGRERKGTAEAYELDYRNIAERMVRGNYEQAQLRKLYDMYLQKGLAYEEYPGGDTKDKYTKVGPIEFKNGIKNLWVRSDLAHELNQALATDKPLPSTLGQAAIGFLNDLQVAGPTDAGLHIGNMWGVIAGSQGGKSMLADIARQVPGVRGLDTMVRIAYNMRRAYMDTPDVQEVIAKLSEIGAGRSVVEHKGLLERVLPTSKLIKLVDRAGRLTLNDMFDNLVQRKLVEDTPEQRREFVNQLGQYNARLRGKVDSVLRESGVSPFIVAGKNFNRLAMQRLLLHPGVQAANINAAVKMRLVNALGLVATVASMPLVINSYTTGRPFGRKDKNIPLGAIDTGKDDKDGNAVIFDLLHGTFLRRALRITGAQGFERSEEGQQPVGEALDTAARQALEGFMGPFTGPFASAAYTAMTGKDVRTGMTVSENPMSQGANAWAAFTRLNPSLAAAYKGWFDDQGGKAKDIAAEELGQVRRAVGVTTARPKSLSQQEHEAGAESMSLAQRAAYQENLESQRKPLTDQKARLAMEESFAVRQRANVESIESSLPREVRAFVSTNQLVLPEYNEKIHLPKQGGQAAGDVTLLPKERVQYQRVMAKEYQTAVRSLMNDSYFDSLDQESKQKALGTVIKQAHVRAKAKMEELLSPR